MVIRLCLLRSLIKNVLKITRIKYGRRTSILMNIKFDSKPVKYIGKKIRLHGDIINKHFNDEKGKKYQKKIFHATVCHSQC